MAWLSIDLNGVFSGRSERKRQRLRGELINTCPHMNMVDLDTDGGLRVHIQSWLESPFGTLDYICRGCGLQQSEFGVNQNQEDWAKRFDANPEAMIDDYFRRVGTVSFFVGGFMWSLHLFG